MDTAQWPQEIGLVKPMDGMMPSSSSTTTATTRPPQLMEKRVRPQKEQALNCPRCNSTNTKFCYYNNYSLTQPRYFCKNCRRYWTEGGSLRNVPVGGGSRKNKRSSSSSLSNTNTNTNTSSLNPSSTIITTTTAPSRKLPTDLTPPPISLSSTSSQNPKFHEGQDLNLAFPHHSLAEFGDFQNIETSSSRNCGNPSTASRALSAMELLRSGINVRGPGPFMPMPMPMPDTSSVYPSGFALHDFRPLTLNFPGGGGGGGGGGGYGGLQGVHEGGDRLLFPFEDLKQGPSSTAEFEQNRGQGGDPPGYWNGMVGGGGSW